MYINTFKYKPEDVDCKLCTEYRSKTGCSAKKCVCLAERIEAGVVGYGEAVMGTFAHCYPLHSRLTLLVRRFPGTLWTDDAHRRRMELLRTWLGHRPKRDTPPFFAAMYLISSNRELCTRAVNCLYRTGVNFRYARLPGIRPEDYALLCAARWICQRDSGLAWEDMADPEIIGEDAFRLIVNALLIARYGTDTLKITGRQ